MSEIGNGFQQRECLFIDAEQISKHASSTRTFFLWSGLYDSLATKPALPKDDTLVQPPLTMVHQKAANLAAVQPYKTNTLGAYQGNLLFLLPVGHLPSPQCV